MFLSPKFWKLWHRPTRSVQYSLTMTEKKLRRNSEVPEYFWLHIKIKLMRLFVRPFWMPRQYLFSVRNLQWDHWLLTLWWKLFTLEQWFLLRGWDVFPTTFAHVELLYYFLKKCPCLGFHRRSWIQNPETIKLLSFLNVNYIFISLSLSKWTHCGKTLDI